MTHDAKTRTSPGFHRHVFVCGHERDAGAGRPSCMPQGSLDLMRQLKHKVSGAGLVNVRVQKAGCLDHCEYGPTCVVYPDSTWYSLRSEADLEAVLMHLLTGEVDQNATMKVE